MTPLKHLRSRGREDAGELQDGPGYTVAVERVVRIFDSFAEAEAADRALYAAMTPQERLDLALLLIERYREGLGEAAQRLERTARIVPLARR